jgi:hypothetical protein
MMRGQKNPEQKDIRKDTCFSELLIRANSRWKKQYNEAGGPRLYCSLRI